MSADHATEAAPAVGVITRKLAPPPAPPRLVEREHLDSRLAALIGGHRVVVVAAAPGAGKTTAVAAACATLERTCAWLSVDRTDQAPGRLVTYLQASLARAVPYLDGIATRALADGIPHPEATGLLVEAVADVPLVVVLDDLQRLADAAEAWAVIEAFVRYAPPTMTIVLVSRLDIPPTMCELPLPPATATLREDELAFTPAEVAQALGHPDSPVPDADVEAVVRATGGWVTGVLFRTGAGRQGQERDDSALPSYLSAHVLAQLDPADRDFLVHTALLAEVDAESATALGVPDAAERLASLRTVHLPVSWQPGRQCLRCYPLFREHLVDLVQHRTPAELRTLQIAKAHLLIDQGHDEEAVEAFLAADAPKDALAPAQRTIGRVVERLDFAVAQRWLDALTPIAPPATPELSLAELLLAIAHDHFDRGAALGDRLQAIGQRDRFVATSDQAAGLLAWCYGEMGRMDEVQAVLQAAGNGPSVEILHWVIERLWTGATDRRRPEPTGGPIDWALFATDYGLGRFEALALPTTSRWTTAVLLPWRIAALRASGHTEEAMRLYTDAARSGRVRGAFTTLVAADLLVDVGQREEALRLMHEGRALAERHAGSWPWMLSWISQARLALRLDRDHESALATLNMVRDTLQTGPWVRLREEYRTWTGFALLLADRVEEARDELRRAVESMVTGDRLLDLPTAAAYLAEAEWRAGDEDAADRAADLALAAARRQGSNHLLLQALADFPAVISRRIDAEPGTDSPWHELGRALLARGTQLDVAIGVTVELRDIGRPQLLIDGHACRPRIAKTYELVAYLAQARDASATRDELLDALFDSRDDDSTRAYLRQAVNQLARLLPDEDALVSAQGVVTLSPNVRITTTSRRFRHCLDEARTQHGTAGLSATLDALRILGDGQYLEGVESAWIEERRRELATLAADARHHAAQLTFEAGSYLDALRLNERVLEDDPIREDAWRLQMEIRGALGDDAGLLASYRNCTRALAELGITPAPSTRRLLERLRH